MSIATRRGHMRPQPELSIVIPAYNEQERLEPTVRSYLDYCRRRAMPAEAIVVDDGSLDGTSRLVERLAAEYPELRLIRLAENCGKGYAVRSGIVNARGRLVLFADADGSTPMEELERLQTAIAAGADIAIGSRALRSETVRVSSRLYRRIVGRAFHLLVRLAGVRGIADTQCGFKLFRGPVAQALFSRMRMTGFSFDVELLILARVYGHPVVEVAVNWRHQPGSRVNLVTDSAAMAWDVLRISARRLRGHHRTPNLAPWSAASNERVVARVTP
jgi:dolichyl-phosphate beta-glucosyltransferase